MTFFDQDFPQKDYKLGDNTDGLRKADLPPTNLISYFDDLKPLNQVPHGQQNIVVNNQQELSKVKSMSELNNEKLFDNTSAKPNLREGILEKLYDKDDTQSNVSFGHKSTVPQRTGDKQQ